MALPAKTPQQMYLSAARDCVEPQDTVSFVDLILTGPDRAGKQTVASFRKS